MYTTAAAVGSQHDSSGYRIILWRLPRLQQSAPVDRFFVTIILVLYFEVTFSFQRSSSSFSHLNLVSTALHYCTYMHQRRAPHTRPSENFNGNDRNNEKQYRYVCTVSGPVSNSSRPHNKALFDATAVWSYSLDSKIQAIDPRCIGRNSSSYVRCSCCERLLFFIRCFKPRNLHDKYGAIIT